MIITIIMFIGSFIELYIHIKNNKGKVLFKENYKLIMISLFILIIATFLYLKRNDIISITNLILNKIGRNKI